MDDQDDDRGHIHGAVFKVLSENGRSPKNHNQGLKDTVLVEDQVDLLVCFDKPASREKPFMYHCHILEHEDAGMMGQFVVIKPFFNFRIQS
ncbi:MAG: multicopper oxidase domain-containing protein [Cohaesibacter sp.]|jgi:FtsP/CotA-like multicopper oxidase with cupredoxin domain|nr:multicopper oxidase domain-containing protein [Cohaesibacter sp.]